ncbi:MAG: hypothetical protein ABR499_01485 [Gemmatimonadaceae bacterium]
MKSTIAATLVLLAVVANPAAAQTRAPRFDLPLLDVPYNTSHGGRAPSMAQSLEFTEGFYELSHLGIERAWGRHRTLAGVSIVFFDVFAVGLPFAQVWLHEEFHRAVMGNRGIGSYNDVYKWDLFSDVVAVSHVRDEDLVRLKAEYPADQVRLGAAGMEGELLLVRELEKNRFFHDSRALHAPLYWLAKLSTFFYVLSGHTRQADELTDEGNANDGANVEVRDFTGHDFTGWAYDLHRPNESYTARGVHPSGVGIDRYIAARDLTSQERSYLERQGYLQLLNLLDPNLVGVHGFTVRSPMNGRPLRMNVSAGHLLTSFGHAIDVNVFLRQDDVNLFAVLHWYENGERVFPGLEAELLDYPVRVGVRQLAVSPRVAVWLQPEDQLFRSRGGEAGGLVAVRVRYPTARRFGVFAEVEGKTAGWVAGNVNLDANVALRLGVSTRLR